MYDISINTKGESNTRPLRANLMAYSLLFFLFFARNFYCWRFLTMRENLSPRYFKICFILLEFTKPANVELSFCLKNFRKRKIVKTPWWDDSDSTVVRHSALTHLPRFRNLAVTFIVYASDFFLCVHKISLLTCAWVWSHVRQVYQRSWFLSLWI